MKNRKGITPIIAVVLLIVIAFVAVGSVATLVTQFTDTDVLDQWEDQQEVEQIDFSIGPGYNSGADEELVVNFRYTGPNDIETIDSDNEPRFGIRYATDGESPVDLGTFDTVFDHNVVATTPGDYNCLEDAGMSDGGAIEILTQGDGFECETGIEFPGGTEAIEVEIYMQEHDQSWEFTCDPGTSSATTCQ